MNFKKSVVLLVFLFLILASFIYVSAITGSIGNARMVLRANLGDKIDKSILVKNVNNVSINIELNAEGDLAEDIIIKDKEFTLSPGEEKKASFTINVKKSGTTESKINVKFSPVEGGTGVGLSSTIIVIANEKNSNFFDFFRNEQGGGEGGGEEITDQVSFGTGSKEKGNSGNKENTANFNSLIVVGITTIILFLSLLILIAMSKKRRDKYKVIKQNKTR